MNTSNLARNMGHNMRSTGRSAYTRVKNSNSTDWGKWAKTIFVGGGLVTLVVLVFTMGKGLINKMKAFFGLDGSPDGQSKFDSTAMGSLLNTITGNTDGASGGGGATGSSGGTSNVNKPWRPIVDKIWEKLEGANAIMYPEVVNKIAHLPKDQVQKCAYYWNATYRKGADNQSLYNFIANEWGANDWLSAKYAPALAALTKAGVGKK